MPHIHILVIFDSKDAVRTTDQFDNIVSAEITDIKTHPRLYDCVMRHMVHHHTKQCWKGNACLKYFPKEYQPQTTSQEDGYPLYKRRSPEQVCISLLFSNSISFILIRYHISKHRFSLAI